MSSCWVDSARCEGGGDRGAASAMGGVRLDETVHVLLGALHCGVEVHTVGRGIAFIQWRGLFA